MGMIRLEIRRSRRKRVSLTALVDVVFILTLFFLLSSTFGVWQATSIELAGDIGVEPSSAEGLEEAKGSRPMLIAMRRKGGERDIEVIVNGVRVPPERLTEAVIRLVEQGTREALVRPSPHIDFQSIVTVMDAAKRAGLASVRLSLE